MDDATLKNIIEAILFASGEAISANLIAQAMELPVDQTKKLIEQLRDTYEYEQRGIRIIQIENKYQMVSRSDYFDYIKKVVQGAPSAFFSQAALETLSIVAYKQPVTRADIEYIRGVQSSSSLDLLIDRGFVRQAGKLDIPGKPLSYETTAEFLKLMEITDTKQLPAYEEFSEGIQLKLEEQAELQTQ